jgi:hypothetical protein
VLILPDRSETHFLNYSTVVTGIGFGGVWCRCGTSFISFLSVEYTGNAYFLHETQVDLYRIIQTWLIVSTNINYSR